MEDDVKMQKRQDFADKLKRLMKQSGDGTQALGDAVGRSNAAVTHWRKARYLPDVETMGMIADRYGVNPLWLEGRENQQETEIVRDGNSVVRPFKKTDDNNCLPFDIQEVMETQDMGTLIPEGATILVKRTIHIEDGEIAYIDIDGTKTVRRIYREKSGILLAADNPFLQPIRLTGLDKKRMTIIGKVVRVSYVPK